MLYLMVEGSDFRVRFYPNMPYMFQYWKMDQNPSLFEWNHNRIKLSRFCVAFTKFQTLIEVYFFLTNCRGKPPMNLQNTFVMVDSQLPEIRRVLKRPLLSPWIHAKNLSRPPVYQKPFLTYNHTNHDRQDRDEENET